MFIDDSTPSLSILELRAKARRELRSAEKGIIIVDYLQLMSPPQSREERQPRRRGRRDLREA